MRKMNKEIYEKVELKIPEEWNVNYNKLLKVNLEKSEELNENIWSELSEDILNIVNYKSNIVIDVGWYPECSRNGHYGLVVIENNEWLRPVESLVTRNTNELIEKIIMLLDKY